MDFLSLLQVPYKPAAFEIRHLCVPFLSAGSPVFHKKKEGLIYNTNSPNPRDSDLISLELDLGISILETLPNDSNENPGLKSNPISLSYLIGMEVI